MKLEIIVMRFHPVVRGQILERVAFFRDENGMFLGAVDGTLASMGVDPQGEMVRRSFVDHDHAVAWAKEFLKQADPDLEVEFEDRDGEAARVALTGVN